MNREDYAGRDATALAALIRGGEVSAAEVQAAARLALAELGPKLNAVVDGPWEQSLAYDPSGRFAGVPFALKDLGCAVAGVPSRAGSFMTGDGLITDEDCHLMMRFRAAGLAGLALATTDELGFGANTDTPRYGRTLNPWNIDLSPGGSSGGSAALVAAGTVPLAHGSDAGGSIRIPASVTGLVGLKPSRGRVPVGPTMQESHWGLATHFVLTRSVRDCAGVLDSLIGPMPGDRTIVAPPQRPWSDELDPFGRRLRVALITEPWGDVPVAPEVAAAVEAAGRALENAGHLVEPPTFSFDWPRMLHAVQVLGCTSTATSIAQLEARTGRKADDSGLQPIILSYRDFGLRFGVVAIGEALETLNSVSRAFGALFQSCDTLLLPNMTVASWRAQDFNPANPPVDALEWMRKMFNVFCYNPVFNVTGMPALSLPIGWTDDGFPIGVQLATRMCDEATLFRMAAELERALPWAHRRPPLHWASLGPNKSAEFPAFPGRHNLG